MKRYNEHLRFLTFIVNALKGNGVYRTPDELIYYIEKQCEIYDIEFGRNKSAKMRLLQRCFHDILDIMGIEIEYHRPKGYHIKEIDEENQFFRYEQLLNDFDILTSLQPDSEVNTYIIPEHHRPEGSYNLYPLIGAIKKHHPVEFDYTDIRRGKTKHIRVDPHYLKENQQRWYLIARNENGDMRIYGTDRIKNLEVNDDETFQRDKVYDPRTAFDDCYGIWNDPRKPIEDIILSFGPIDGELVDGEFLKRTPLHKSQHILVDNGKEFRISLRLRITNDFIMAIISRCRTLTVIQPESLRETIRQYCQGAAERNK